MKIKKVKKTTIVSDDGIIINSIEPTGENRKKIWFQKGKNLFDKEDIIEGYYINNNGNLQADATTFCSNYIEVDATKTVVKTRTNWNSVGFYDKNKIFISRTPTLQNGKLVFPENCKYIRISDLIENLNIVQVEYNTEMTNYESYINPTVYIKNEQDIYEKFIEKQDNKIETATLTLSADYSFTTSAAWQGVKINFDKISNNNPKLYFSDNGIKIGKGVNKVLVSAAISLDNFPHTTQLYIRKTNKEGTATGLKPRRLERCSEVYTNVDFPPLEILVTEGDTISLGLQTSIAITEAKNIKSEFTFMTVQTVQ